MGQVSGPHLLLHHDRLLCGLQGLLQVLQQLGSGRRLSH